MALQYGINITQSDMKKLLEQNDKLQSGIRTWRQLFGNASLGFNAQSDALTADYSDAIAQAYRTNFAQNNAIMGSGLNIGATKEMLSTSRNDLHAAYESYVRNYGNDMASLAETYNEEVSAIDTALAERAQNFADLYNSAYKYLSEELYGSYQILPGTAENGATAIYEGEGKNSKFKGYEDINVDYMQEHNLSWLTDDNGNILPWNSISQKIFNSDGSLNRYGVQFFDQMFNTLPENYMTTEGERTRGFDEWLSETSPELREWYVSQDMFNYNFAGTNRGTSQVLTGRESTDDRYGTYEYIIPDGMNSFNIATLNSKTSLTDALNATNAYQKYLSAKSKANSVYSSATGTYKNKMSYDEVQAAIGKDTTAEKAEYDRAEKKARESWNTYRAEVSNANTKLLDYFKTKVGSNLYTEFVNNNSVYNEFDSIMQKLEDYVYADENYIKKLTDVYNELLREMNAYIKKYRYDSKTSGF